MKKSILEIARGYLRDMAAGTVDAKHEEYYSQNVKQIEYPNRLNARVTVSDYQSLLQRSEQGKKIVLKQSYDVQREYVVGNTVIMEVIWKGSFSIPIGETPPGRELMAYFALFLDFEGNKIVNQRNYDCFEPF